MAKKNPTSRKDKKLTDKISVLDRAAKLILTNIDNSYAERQLLSDKDSRIQATISNELEMAKGVSDGHIVDFVSSMRKKEVNQKGAEIDLFTQDIGNIFGYFQEMNKNRYVELSDLRFITKFIPAIGEAVNTTLDAIVTSDDFSNTITKNIELPESLSENEKSMVMSTIEEIEESYDIPKKLKNIVFQNALVSGSCYIYTLPYSDLFSEYNRLVKSGALNENPLVHKPQKLNNSIGFNLKSATESSLFTNPNSSIVKEAFDIDKYESELGNTLTTSEKNVLRKELENNLAHYEIVDSPVLSEALEGYRNMEYMKNNLSDYSKYFGGVGSLSNNDVSSELSMDYDSDTKSHKGTFVTGGSYIKIIEANRIVPVRIFNQIIGYFYVHDTTITNKINMMTKASSETNIASATANIFSATSLNEDKRNKAAQAIISIITEGILNNFSEKFVNDHADFKNLIADCIINAGLVNNSYQIQFIPAMHIVPFTINEDGDGNGHSILSNSLFPAKLLLSVIVAKLLNYMNNSGNKTIAHIQKGPIDVNTSNQTQRVIRMLQEGNITFSDLLSTNLSFAKFNRNKNMLIPRARNGDRLVEFEVQEGQDVSMDTEMERYLEKLAILGTPVPSVIMEYSDTADYAKSIVTANIKFGSRVASFQSELERGATLYYRKLIMASHLDDKIKEKVKNTLKYKLARPKVITNSNMSDYLTTVQSAVEMMLTMVAFDENEKDGAKIKAEATRNLSMNMLPFIDWNDVRELVEQARLTVVKKSNLSSDDSSSNSENMDEF